MIKTVLQKAYAYIYAYIMLLYYVVLVRDERRL